MSECHSHRIKSLSSCYSVISSTLSLQVPSTSTQSRLVHAYMYAIDRHYGIFPRDFSHHRKWTLKDTLYKDLAKMHHDGHTAFEGLILHGNCPRTMSGCFQCVELDNRLHMCIELTYLTDDGCESLPCTLTIGNRAPRAVGCCASDREALGTV